jgi:hypothetical protein
LNSHFFLSLVFLQSQVQTEKFFSDNISMRIQFAFDFFPGSVFFDFKDGFGYLKIFVLFPMSSIDRDSNKIILTK